MSPPSSADGDGAGERSPQRRDDLRRRAVGGRLEIDGLERHPRRQRGLRRDAAAGPRRDRGPELHPQRDRAPVRQAPHDDDRRARRRSRQRVPRPARPGGGAGAVPVGVHGRLLQHRGRRGARDRRGRRAARAAGRRLPAPGVDRARPPAAGVAAQDRCPDGRDRPAPAVDRLGRAAGPGGWPPGDAAPRRPRPPAHRLRPHLDGRGQRRPRPPRRLPGGPARGRARDAARDVVGAGLRDDPSRPHRGEPDRRDARPGGADRRVRLERLRRDRPDRGLRGGRSGGPRAISRWSGSTTSRSRA